MPNPSEALLRLVPEYRKTQDFLTKFATIKDQLQDLGCSTRIDQRSDGNTEVILIHPMDSEGIIWDLLHQASINPIIKDWMRLSAEDSAFASLVRTGWLQGKELREDIKKQRLIIFRGKHWEKTYDSLVAIESPQEKKEVLLAPQDQERLYLILQEEATSPASHQEILAFVRMLANDAPELIQPFFQVLESINSDARRHLEEIIYEAARNGADERLFQMYNLLRGADNKSNQENNK